MPVLATRPTFGPDHSCRCGALVYYAYRPGDPLGRLMNVDRYGPHVCWQPCPQCDAPVFMQDGAGTAYDDARRTQRHSCAL